MKAYVGDTRSRKLLAKMRAHDVGQIIIRGRLRGRRLDSWAYDNGAFEDWRHGAEFDETQFVADLEEIDSMWCKPDFVVLPDRVGEGKLSLKFSMSWRERLHGSCSVPLYVAAQDGLLVEDIPWGEIDGLFMGGTLPWKLANARNWCIAAHAHGVPFHFARCGTARRVALAKAIMADSLDSCLPLWSAGNCSAFLGALAQSTMFYEV